MTPTTESLQSRLLEATNLLDRFRTGTATTQDHQKAVRILQEGRKDETWINEDQLFPLSCLVVEAAGGKLQGTEGTSRRHYMLQRTGRWIPYTLNLIVDVRTCGSIQVSAWKVKTAGISTSVGSHIVTPWDRINSLKGLIRWTQTL